jgi:hypothetical protein
MKPKRLKVKETERFYEDFDNTLETIIARLQCELDEGWEGIEREYEQDYGNHDRYLVYYLYKYREETDEEYDNRVELLQKREQEQKIKRLEQLRKEISSMSDEDKKLLGL